jgi:arabinan endo-1,5-alpha-L-arabinosidase
VNAVFYRLRDTAPLRPAPRWRSGALRGVLPALLACCFLQGCGAGGSSVRPSASSPPLSVATSSLAAATVGTAYSASLAASGGSGTGYSWTVSSGSLPSGLSLAASGSISGTPSTAGTFDFIAQVTDSASHTATADLSIAVASAPSSGPLASYTLTGDTSPVHDPSIIRAGSTYYVFSTDQGAQSGHIPIRCSTDKLSWTACGYVFSSLPSWVAAAVPNATTIWAPDISYFNGMYHVYYAVSTFGSQVSAIGLATNTTLDETSPNYQWVDQGIILQSTTGDDFNAIDPNILVDSKGSVWLQYGSFWDGIYQQQIDPSTGKIVAGGPIYHLAERAASVPNDPIEGSSLVHVGNYYYLFVSWDYCCEANPAQSNYKIVVGRGTSPHGPFYDETGANMLYGGGTILLQGVSTWGAIQRTGL